MREADDLKRATELSLQGGELCIHFMRCARAPPDFFRPTCLKQTRRDFVPSCTLIAFVDSLAKYSDSEIDPRAAMNGTESISY